MSLYRFLNTNFKHHFNGLLVHGCIALLVFSAGCVSVNLGGRKPSKNTDVKFEVPWPPFEELSSTYLDQAWRNPSNGNTISFLSECGNSYDPPLDQIQRGILSEIENLQILEQHRVDYNARTGIHSIVRGSVDGVLHQLQMLVFKKNNCNYILTYTALIDKFGENQRTFYWFAKRFQAP